MMKILKSISVFSLWIAGLTLSAHLLLPHDHHIDDTTSNQNKNCPVSNNKSGFPVHCHAFNDLTSEKSRPNQISQKIPFYFIAFSNFSDTSDFDLQIPCGGITDLQKPVFDSFTLELSLLRAPPASA